MFKFKQKILDYAVRLFPLVDLEKVLTSNRQGQLFLNGTAIESKKLSDLKSEARLFRNTQLWDIIHNTLKHQAQLAMFTNATTTQDILNGKTILRTLDIQENIVQLIDKAK